LFLGSNEQKISVPLFFLSTCMPPSVESAQKKNQIQEHKQCSYLVWLRFFSLMFCRSCSLFGFCFAFRLHCLGPRNPRSPISQRVTLLRVLLFFHVCQVCLTPGFWLFGRIGRSHVRGRGTREGEGRRRESVFQSVTAQQSYFFWVIYILFSLIFFRCRFLEINLSCHPLYLFNFQCWRVILPLVQKVIDFHQRNHSKDG